MSRYLRIFLLSVLLPGLAAGGDPNRVLVIHDELPQMEVLSAALEERGGFEVTLAEQDALPADWSGYRAVIAYIHRKLHEPTEKAIIAYTENGGRLVALHHSISSGKAKNEHWFDFLGIHLDLPGPPKLPVMPGEGYGYREHITLTLVNLDPGHYITSHEVKWDEEIPYTSSDRPDAGGRFPSLSLHDSEAYMNHKFTDGRAKTVLCGMKFHDDRNDQLFMQDRACWTKPHGDGEIVYFMPGHGVSEFQHPGFSQMIINAIKWSE